MKEPIFKNDEIQKSFNLEGIVRIPVFTENEIDQFAKLFNERHPPGDIYLNSGYFVSIFNPDIAYRKRVFDSFYPLLIPKLDEVFSNYKVLTIVAQIKDSGAHSEVGVHQDLAVVDETKYYNCTCWIPLMDSTPENGAISALNRSQRVARSFRTHTLDYQFSEVEDYIRSNSTCYPAKKGELLIFDAATLHFSAPNTTKEVRKSLALSIVTAAAPVQIGYFDKNSMGSDVEVYDVPDNFWYLYKNFACERGQRPAFGQFNRKLENSIIQQYEKRAFIKAYGALIENDKK